MSALLAILDGISTGWLVFYLFSFLPSNTPFTVLLKGLLGIISGVAYFGLCAELCYGELAAKVSSLTESLVIFVPAGLMAIFQVVIYMLKNEL